MKQGKQGLSDGCWQLFSLDAAGQLGTRRRTLKSLVNYRVNRRKYQNFILSCNFNVKNLSIIIKILFFLKIFNNSIIDSNSSFDH